MMWCRYKCCWSDVILEQERFQFAQETVKAEAWLKAKEPLITSKEPEGGEAPVQTDEVEQLILRHEAFRKAAVTWKERFSSLRQLSAVSSAADKCLISVVESQFSAAAGKYCDLRMLRVRNLHWCMRRA